MVGAGTAREERYGRITKNEELRRSASPRDARPRPSPSW